MEKLFLKLPTGELTAAAEKNKKGEEHMEKGLLLLINSDFLGFKDGRTPSLPG